MTLRDTIVDDALTVFTNPSDFAEPVTYTKATGSTRTINAVVIRDQWGSIPGTETEAPLIEVHVANDATSGITSSEIVVGQDSLALAVRVGQAATRRFIQRIISHDEGMLVLQCS